MYKWILLVSTLAGLCMGVACRVSFPGDDGDGGPLPPGYVPLDQMNASITIDSVVGDASATVTAILTDRLGRRIDLDLDQAILINGVALVETDSEGEYEATIPIAVTYPVSVNEPTRGVEVTEVNGPDNFAITSPVAGASASLSGFSILWSSSEPALQSTVTLEQTLFDELRTITRGPTADTGTLELTSADLSGFGQGADLSITLSKVRYWVGVQGLNSATVTVIRSQTIAVVPAP